MSGEGGETKGDARATRRLFAQAYFLARRASFLSFFVASIDRLAAVIGSIFDTHASPKQTQLVAKTAP